MKKSKVNVIRRRLTVEEKAWDRKIASNRPKRLECAFWLDNDWLSLSQQQRLIQSVS